VQSDGSFQLTDVEDIVTPDVSNQIHHPHKYLGFANVNIQKGIDPNTKIENTNKHLGFANINLFTCDFVAEGPCKFEFLLHLLRSLHVLSTTFLSAHGSLLIYLYNLQCSN
jgi:hypothetical protein